MTEAKSTRRRRRTTGGTAHIPLSLVEWFSGNRVRAPGRSAVPWAALAFPDYVFVGENWCAWKAMNPGALPPPGWEWLDNSSAPGHRQPHWVMETARRLIAARPR